MDMSDSRSDIRHHNDDRPIPMSSNMVPLAEPKNVQDLTQYVSVVLQQMQDRFQTMSDQILSRIDEMGTRIDDLERNIADLMAQAGPEEAEKSNTQF